MWPREYHIILKHYDLITGLLKIQDALSQKLLYIYIRIIASKIYYICMCSVSINYVYINTNTYI